MFVYSVRSKTIKFFAVIVLALAAMITLVAVIPAGDIAASAGISYSDVYSNDDRIKFLSQFGWEVSGTPIEEVTVTVPKEFDTVYVGYNEMQKEQGLNLARYKGKDVTRYTYQITNYENYDGTVYANLLVYRGKIIGGDICSADTSGFVHGFSADVKYKN